MTVWSKKFKLKITVKTKIIQKVIKFPSLAEILETIPEIQQFFVLHFFLLSSDFFFFSKSLLFHQKCIYYAIPVNCVKNFA